MITIHHRYRRTDRRTDGQTTCDRNTALCTKVHRAVKTQCVWLDLDCSHVQKVNSVQPVSVSGQNVLDIPKSTVNVSSPSEAVLSEIDYQISDFVFLVRIRAPALNSLSTGALEGSVEL